MNQYWSPHEPLLVTIVNHYWLAMRPVLVRSVTSTTSFFLLLCSALCSVVTGPFDGLLKGLLRAGKASPYPRSEGRDIWANIHCLEVGM